MHSLARSHALVTTLLCLFAATTSAQAQSGGIRDNGAFFSESAKSEASRHVGEIGSRFKKDLLIETFKTVPDEVKRGVNLQDRAAVNRMFEQWTVRQAREQRVNGIYILLSKDPAHLQIVVGTDTQSTHFSLRDRDSLVSTMLTRLRAKQNDEALLEGVNFVAATMRSHLAAPRRGPVQASAATATPAEAPNPWGWVIAAVLGFIGAWIVVGLIRSIFNSGNTAGAGGATGGGFLTSLLGGMFGAAAGMWLYDQFSGHHGSDGDRGSSDDSGGFRRDTDYSSSGGSFSDDSGGGDIGGGDSGGGDSGGGDF